MLPFRTGKWIIGQANKTLEYYDGVLKLTYGQGDEYHTKPDEPSKYRKVLAIISVIYYIAQ